jgi:hypothetical protein
MGVDYRVFYGYGYDISNEKAFNLSPEKFDELADSNYTIFLDGYSDDRACFFGLTLATVEGCTSYQIPVVDEIDHNELHEMLTEYRNIFDIKPNEIAHHYIGFAVT